MKLITMLLKWTGIVGVLMAINFPGSLCAQRLLSDKCAEERIMDLTSGNRTWTTASWQGKLRADMLPVSISVKVFLRNGSEMLVSLRAPLFGEVARVEIDTVQALVVNKMKRRYWKRNIQSVSKSFPYILECMQSAMIGRPFVAGKGELTPANAEGLSVYEIDGDCTLMTAGGKGELENFSYGFALNDASQMLNLVMQYSESGGSSGINGAAPCADKKGMSLSAEMEYSGKSVNANLDIDAMGINLRGVLEAGPIAWDEGGISRTDVSRGYKETTLKECLAF